MNDGVTVQETTGLAGMIAREGVEPISNDLDSMLELDLDDDFDETDG